MGYPYSRMAPSYMNPSHPLAMVANVLRGPRREHGAASILDPRDGTLWSTDQNFMPRERVGRVAYGKANTTFNFERTEPDQYAASWLTPPPDQRDNEWLDVKAVGDGKYRVGMQYAARHAALLENGESLNTRRPIYQGAEVDVLDVAEHLRVLKLHPRIQGLAPRKFHAAKGCHHTLADFLDFRIVLADPNVGGGYRQGPFAEAERSRSDFYECEVTCRKDRETVGYPVETLRRANKFSPIEVDAKNAALSLAFKRNKSVISELMNIGNRVDENGIADSSAVLPSMSERNSNGKSTNNILANFLQIQAAQGVLHKVNFDTMQMGPLAFLHLTQNDLLRGGGEFGRMPVAMAAGGVIELPTLSGVKVVIDQRHPRDRIHFYERETAMWVGEGMKLTQMLDEKSQQARYADITDWYDVMCPHPQITDFSDRLFGCTMFLHSSDRVAPSA